MTSSSSLYGSVTTQNTSSGNSTGLYGEAGTPIPDSSGNVVVRGDLWVLSGNILTTAQTGNIFPQNATTVNLGLAATSVNIGAGTGTTTINNDLQVNGTFIAPSADFGNITIAVADDQTITTTAGELRLGSFNGSVKLTGIDSLYTDTTGTFNLLNQPTTIFAFRNATTLEIGEDTGTTGINNNLRVDGTTINLAQATNILYSEANNRLNRPSVRSTTGNTSGFRVEAPNATTSAISNISAFSSNDNDNGKFINIQARGSATGDLRIGTGKYTAGVLGPSGTVISFVDNITTYATVNPAGPTNSLDLTTKSYVDSLSGTTYTINASTVTGGANFNLVGSDATTDTIKFAGTGGTTVTRTDANTITIDTAVPADPTKLVNGVYEFTLNADGTVTTPSKISAAGPFTLQGGALDPTTVVIDDISLVATFDETLPGGDVAVLTATNGSLTWAHTAGAMVIGSEDGTWSLNNNGTTSFPNFTFPYADGTSNQVLRTNGSGVLSWYSPSDLNTTYTIDASSTTGGANFNLVGSDASTDTIKLANGTGVTVSQTSANEIGFAIGQPVATSDSVTFADVTLDTLVNLNTATLTTTTTAANQVADSFVAATYRTCKYVIQITSGSAYQAVEALLVHDGSSAFINTYSDVRTGANLTSINAVVNGANIELQVTPVNAATTYKISKTLIAV